MVSRSELVINRFAELRAAMEVPADSFRQLLVETIVMAVWLQRDIEVTKRKATHNFFVSLSRTKREQEETQKTHDSNDNRISKAKETFSLSSEIRNH